MKDVLLLVDMQRGFARHEQTVALTGRIEGLLATGAFDAVLATRFLNGDDSTYEQLLSWSRLKEEADQQLAPSLAPYVDCVVDKYTYNCVNASFLQRLCQLAGGSMPERVFIAGADTDCCVLVCATALFELNVRPVVLARYCDSNGGPESHAAGLRCLARLIGKGQICDREISGKADLAALG